MAITLDLPPEEEQTLRQQAEMTGQEVTEYLREIVRGKIQPASVRPSHEEWKQLVQKLVKTVGPDVPPLSDYALSREGMYERRE